MRDVIRPLMCGAVLLLAGGATEPDSVTVSGVTLRSVAVSLPSEDQPFPGGESAALIGRVCTPCHSPAMILAQPAMSRTAWRDEVNKMRTTYKALFLDEDVPHLVNYLATHKGTP
jgi:hypothetical protein